MGRWWIEKEGDKVERVSRFKIGKGGLYRKDEEFY